MLKLFIRKNRPVLADVHRPDSAMAAFADAALHSVFQGREYRLGSESEFFQVLEK